MRRETAGVLPRTATMGGWLLDPHQGQWPLMSLLAGTRAEPSCFRVLRIPYAGTSGAVS
jgi:hypothetical protein